MLGTGRNGIDWAMAMVAGLAGSFVGGLLASLIAGDGLALKPSGLIGSFVGAVIVTAIWRWIPRGVRPRRHHNAALPHGAVDPPRANQWYLPRVATLVLGPMLRHVGETTATIWVETDESCTVEVLGHSARPSRCVTTITRS